MLEYHAGCRPGYGRIPYNPPKRQVVPDPFHDHDDEVDCSCLPKPHVYLELPLAFDQRYEDALGSVRIEITREGHNDLCDALGGECPHCGRAMGEGELHS